MNTEQNKRIVRRFFEELWNERELSVAEQIFSADCITHQLRSGEEIAAVHRGPADMRSHTEGWLRGFPDIQFRVEEMIAENDRVTTRCEMTGTHKSEWMGIPATNKRISIRMFTTHRIKENKIAEDWVLVESLGFFQQLGLIGAIESIISATGKN